jgi:hypothetical protein
MGRALDIIQKLTAVEFDWKHNNQHDISFIAEEVEKVLPEAVFYNDKGQVEGIRIIPIVCIMVEAIKELANGKESKSNSTDTKLKG